MKNIGKRISAGLATLAFAGAGLIGGAAPAQAAFDCGYNMCIWFDEYYQGAKGNYSISSSTYMNDYWSDDASSLHNRLSSGVRYYQHADFIGESILAYGYESVPQLSVYNVYLCNSWCTTWDNQISSFRRV